MFRKPILRLKVMTPIVSRYPGFWATHSLTARYTITWFPKSKHMISKPGNWPSSMLCIYRYVFTALPPVHICSMCSRAQAHARTQRSQALRVPRIYIHVQLWASPVAYISVAAGPRRRSICQSSRYVMLRKAARETALRSTS